MKSLTTYLEECLNYELSKIDESLSVFDGCEILLINTIEFLENNLDKNIIKNKFSNLFFNELNIHIDRWNRNGNIQFAYVKKNNNFDENNLKLNICEIHCELPVQIKDVFFQKAKSICRNQLLHEFTHCYQDYKENVKQHLENHFSTIDVPNKVLKELENIEIGFKLDVFFKFTNRTERNTYLAEMYNSLVEHKIEILKSTDKIKKCLEIIKDTKIYKQLVYMFAIKKELENKNMLKQYAIVYNVSTKSVLSEGDVKRKMTNAINKTINKTKEKLDKVIAKQIVRALEYFKSQNESILVGDVVNILDE